jgi:hypothetical protein
MSRKRNSLLHKGVTSAFGTKTVNKSFDAASIRRDKRNRRSVFRHKKRAAFPKLKALGTQPIIGISCDRNLLPLFHSRMIFIAALGSDSTYREPARRHTSLNKSVFRRSEGAGGFNLPDKAPPFRVASPTALLPCAQTDFFSKLFSRAAKAPGRRNARHQIMRISPSPTWRITLCPPPLILPAR